MGRNPVFDPNYKSVGCNTFISTNTLHSELHNYHYYEDTDPDHPSLTDYRVKEYDELLDDVVYHTLSYLTKDEYIDYAVNSVAIDDNKLYHFNRLSRNSDCCDLYIYVTSDPKKIIESDDHQYVLLTHNEEKALWSME